MVQKGTKQNAFVTGFTNIVLNAIPGLFKECPFSGHLELLNFTITGELFRYVAKGVFRVTFHLYNDFDDMILGASYIFAKTNSRLS